VQAGHAVAEYLIKNTNQWTNETLVYLGVQNLEELHKWMQKLDSKNIEYTQFNEPDLENQATAIAICNNDKEFKKLKLI
jgi:hypothetical protein